MGSISPCFESPNCKSRYMSKILGGKNWAAFPPVLNPQIVRVDTCQKSWGEKLGSISPCCESPNCKSRYMSKILGGKMGQHFPLFLNPQIVRVDTCQKSWGEKWGSISPCFESPNCKSRYMSKILGENWAAFPPVLNPQIVRVDTCQKSWGEKLGSISPCFESPNCKSRYLSKILGGKIGQHFPLF